LNNLIIKQKLEDTIEYAYCVFRHFPKSERFTLVADLKRSLTRMLELIKYELNKSRNKFPSSSLSTAKVTYEETLDILKGGNNHAI